MYDVTPFLDEHPGGDEVLKDVAGTDASDAFDGRLGRVGLVWRRERKWDDGSRWKGGRMIYESLEVLRSGSW